MQTVTLTDDECNVLRAILYGAVGGPVSGRLGEPRSVASAIAEKVPWPDPGKYKVTIETVSRFGSQAAVIRRTAAEAAGGKEGMSDLVERLRDESWMLRGRTLPMAELEVWHKTCCEAADEIERLTKRADSEVRYAESRARRIVPDAPQGESFGLMMDRVETEFERLQAIANAAKAYVAIKTRHPQVAGEAYRDLCDAIEAAEAATKGEKP